MILTIGYAKLTRDDLADLIDRVWTAVARPVHLVDVRSNPGLRGRCRAGFRQRDLEADDRLLYYGAPELGGRKAWRYVNEVKQLLARHPTSIPMLMCAEHAPGDCHRHEIALECERQGRRAMHLFEDTIVEAGDLQRSIETGDDYDCWSLAPFLRDVAGGDEPTGL